MVGYTRELVARRAKTKEIVAFLGVPKQYVREVYQLQLDASLRKAPQGLTKSLATARFNTATRQLYATMATDFERLLANGLSEIDAGMTALRRGFAADNVLGGGTQLCTTTWLSLCRSLRCGLAVLRRCRSCNSNILLEDASEDRCARLLCLWCGHDSGFVDFIAHDRKRRESPR